jgi:hypothetical protein
VSTGVSCVEDCLICRKLIRQRLSDVSESVTSNFLILVSSLAATSLFMLIIIISCTVN